MIICKFLPKQSKNLLGVFLLLCIYGLIFANADLQSKDFLIIDERNLLSDDFLQYWNKTLNITQAECFVKTRVLIFGDEKKQVSVSDKLETFPSPEITIIYKDNETGFEIFQSNFENFPNDRNFIIPSYIFDNIIPDANMLFKNGKTNEAVEYILVNIQEILYPPRAIEEKNDTNSLQNTGKIYYLYAISIFIVVFLLFVVIIKKKRKPKNENRSYLFNSMSKDDFFGGGFDNI